MIVYFNPSQSKFLHFHFSLFLSKHLHLTQTFGLMTTSKFSRAFSLSVTKCLALEAEVRLRGRTLNYSHLFPISTRCCWLKKWLHVAPLAAAKGRMTEY